MFSTFFVTFHTFWIKQKGWNRWIPALFDPCERGELNPHEHTLTATAVFAKRMHKAVRREEGGGPVDLQTMEPSFVQKAAFA